MDSNHRPHAYQACALTRLSYRPIGIAFGGPDRVRTDDLLDANQALSQLSYGPKDLAMDAHCALPKNLGANQERKTGAAWKAG